MVESPEPEIESVANPALKWLMGLAACVIIIAGMRAASQLLVPFLLAAFLAVISSAPLHWLQDKGVPRFLSMLIVMVFATSIFVFGVIVVGASIQNVIARSDTYIGKLQQMSDNVEKQINEWQFKIEELIEKNKKRAGDDEEGAAENEVPKLVAEQAELAPVQNQGHDAKVREPPFDDVGSDGIFDVERIFGLFRQLLVSLTSLFSNTFMVVLTLVFILLEGSGFSQKILALSDHGEEKLKRVERITLSIRHYVSIKTWLSLLTGLLITTWLIVIGMPYALMWGVLAFFFNFIPNIGSILAAIPAILIAILEGEDGSWSLALNTTICFLVVNIMIGNVIEPRVMGQGLGLSTLVVFVSLVFWGWIFGPLGMLLSVPLTMIFKIVLSGTKETRWLAILLSDNPDTLPPLHE